MRDSSGLETQGSLVARSFAKINLFLSVGARRPDGFHDIETIFQTVDLSDELILEPSKRDVTLTCDRAELSCNEDNLILRAANALRCAIHRDKGARIHLRKRVPIAAGLAGGSGNAAATLLGLKALWELDLQPERLAAIALSLGSDVPYCLVGGTAAATGRGEILRPLSPISDVWFVLVHPPIEVSTAWVYQHPGLARNDSRDSETRAFRDANDALALGDWRACLFNAMESVVFAQYPELLEIKLRLVELGCVAAVMSGSGPTIVGVAASESAARFVGREIAPQATSVARPVARGVELERLR